MSGPACGARGTMPTSGMPLKYSNFSTIVSSLLKAYTLTGNCASPRNRARPPRTTGPACRIFGNLRTSLPMATCPSMRGPSPQSVIGRVRVLEKFGLQALQVEAERNLLLCLEPWIIHPLPAHHAGRLHRREEARGGALGARDLVEGRGKVYATAGQRAQVGHPFHDDHARAQDHPVHREVLGGEIRQSRAVLLEEVEADVLGAAVHEPLRRLRREIRRLG